MIIGRRQTDGSLNESVDNKVDRGLDGCAFAIVLARLEQGVKQDGLTLPRANIIDEIGRIRQRLDNQHIILLESGLSLPSNQSTGVIWQSYEADHFEAAILKVIHSLKANGLL